MSHTDDADDLTVRVLYGNQYIGDLGVEVRTIVGVLASTARKDCLQTGVREESAARVRILRVTARQNVTVAVQQ